MTLVSQIIIDAHRLSNILAIGDTPTDDEMDEGLRYLNRIVKSVFGNEMGDPLVAFPIGRTNINRPSGFPWYDTTPSSDWFVPKNLRAVLNLAAPVSLYLHPEPDDGSRFAALDTANNLATYPVTVYGNGRNIEGANSITLNTNGFDAEWFYRADLGNWQKYTPLAIDDTFPFPEEFEDFFVTSLAIRINPAYGITMSTEASAIFTRSRAQFRARYNQEVPVPSELALIRMPKVAADRDYWGKYYTIYSPNGMFNRGWPW